MDNPMVTNVTQATKIGEWARQALAPRRTVAGEFRPDTRLSAGDMITVENKYDSVGNRIFVTNIKYEYNGAFKGSFEGRLVE